MMKLIVEVIEILAARSTQEKKWHGQLFKSEPYEILARASLGGSEGGTGGVRQASRSDQSKGPVGICPLWQSHFITGPQCAIAWIAQYVTFHSELPPAEKKYSSAVLTASLKAARARY